jgi:capsular exopolysaccharide synthesis family protein
MAEATRKIAKAALPSLIAETDVRSPASEAYRALRTNVQFASLDRPCRTIVITSAGSAEGKTTTAANFCVVSAQAGSRVCLVDADLRRPSLHRVFGLPNGRGLSSALVEDLPLSAVAQETTVPGLSVVVTGPLPPNPAEMVGSRRMKEILQAALADFDLVVCDTPPLISVTDAVALGAQCDGVILVVRSGVVPHTVVRRAAEQLEAVKGRVIGVLLNDVDLRRYAYAHEYYRYLRSYYSTRLR